MGSGLHRIGVDALRTQHTLLQSPYHRLNRKKSIVINIVSTPWIGVVLHPTPLPCALGVWLRLRTDILFTPAPKRGLEFFFFFCHVEKPWDDPTIHTWPRKTPIWTRDVAFVSIPLEVLRPSHSSELKDFMHPISHLSSSPSGGLHAFWTVMILPLTISTRTEDFASDLLFLHSSTLLKRGAIGIFFDAFWCGVSIWHVVNIATYFHWSVFYPRSLCFDDQTVAQFLILIGPCWWGFAFLWAIVTKCFSSFVDQFSHRH